MASTGYTPWAVTAGEQPTTAYWNILGANDASFNSGSGLNDGAIVSRHLASGIQVATAAQNPYKFSVYMSSNVSLTANVWTKAQLNTAFFDTSGNFDVTTNFRFTAPVPGFYAFMSQTAVSTSGISTGYGTAALYKNGSLFIEGNRQVGSGSATTIPRIPINALLQLNANDYIELYGFCSEGTRAIGGGSTLTYLTGFLVSAT